MHGPDTSKQLTASGYVVDADTTIVVSALSIHSEGAAGGINLLEGEGGTIRWQLECVNTGSEGQAFPTGLAIKGAYIEVDANVHACIAYH